MKDLSEKLAAFKKNATASTGRVLGTAQELAADASKLTVAVGKAAGEAVGETIKKIDENHEKVTERLETISKVTGLASAAAAVAAVITAPKGFAAIGMELGLTRAPLLVRAAPVLWIVATVAGLVSGCMYFYSRWRRSHGK